MSTRRDFLMQAAVTGGVVVAANGYVASGVHKDTAVSARVQLKTYKIPHTDLEVSRIAYGCALLVEQNKEPLNAVAISTAGRVLNTAYDHGINFFDTADMYSFGKSEVVVGKALCQSPGLRNEVVIQSKCGIEFENSQPGDPYHLNCSREYIVSATEGSLRRLGTDYLDILLLHWPDALMQPEEVGRAFDELKQSGKVRYFGVSNHTASQIELLKKYVHQPLVANQIHLSLADSYLMAGGLAALWPALWRGGRAPYDYISCAGALDYCRLHDIQVQAYSPLRGGLLSPAENATQEVKQAAQALAELARKKNSTPSAISLAWLLRHPAGIVPIIGATNPEHVVDNCTADSVDLSYDEWYGLLVSTVNLASLKAPIKTS